MQTVNFITGEGYKIDHFPDGEKHLVLTELDRKEQLSVVCRIKSSDDLFLLMQLKDILTRQEVDILVLKIYYLMGMRMDRVISFNGSYTLKIIAEVINSLQAREVIIVEPHSHKTLEIIKNTKVYPLLPYLGEGCLCYPDRGAYERNGRNGLCCSKRRDADDGSIVESFVVNPEIFKGGEIIVQDDLCDGGGTFVGIAPKLRELNPAKITLCVTHAIQKSGIEKVAALYDEVVITNSYADWDKIELPDNVKVVNVF